jgi:DnaJ-domain-containing protein 1
MMRGLPATPRESCGHGCLLLAYLQREPEFTAFGQLMGFFFRKSIGFGPLRLNLSRSGLGASVGVPGARIGTGPRGSYVSLGRGGFYYRQNIGRRPHHRATEAAPPSEPVPSAPTLDPSDEFVADLTRITSRRELFPSVAIALGLAALVSFRSFGPLAASALSLVAIMLLVAVRQFDVRRTTAILHYDVADPTGLAFGRLCVAFRSLSTAKGLWAITSQERTADVRRNAGAGTLVNRQSTRVRFTKPPRVEANISFPTLTGPTWSLYCLPDRLLIYAAGCIRSVGYDKIDPALAQVNFREAAPAPSDAAAVGRTWIYVNKDGSPDRRFRNNRQIPILLYGELTLTTPGGWSVLIQCSQPRALETIAKALIDMRPQPTGAQTHPGQTPEADELATMKPRYWEYQMAAALLEGGMATTSARFSQPPRATQRAEMSPETFVPWLKGCLDRLPATKRVEPLVNALNTAFGPPGHAGDPSAIRSACQALLDYSNELATWFGDVVPARRADGSALQMALGDFATQIFKGLAVLPSELRRIAAEGAAGTLKNAVLSIQLNVGQPAERFQQLFNEFRARDRSQQSEGTKRKRQNQNDNRQHERSRDTANDYWRQAKPPENPPSLSPHEVLGVSLKASQEEIAAAYRRLALQNHPDKVAALDPAIREFAERRMKAINEAYAKIHG